MIDIVCMIDINIFVWREKAPLDIYVVIDDCMLCKNKSDRTQCLNLKCDFEHMNVKSLKKLKGVDP